MSSSVGAGAANDYGNRPVVPGTPVDTAGYHEQTTATETLVHGETYTSEWRAFLPADVVITAADHLVVNGVTCEVIGPPHHAYNPRLRHDSHVEVHLRVVQG